MFFIYVFNQSIVSHTKYTTKTYLVWKRKSIEPFVGVVTTLLRAVLSTTMIGPAVIGSFQRRWFGNFTRVTRALFHVQEGRLFRLLHFGYFAGHSFSLFLILLYFFNLRFSSYSLFLFFPFLFISWNCNIFLLLFLYFIYIQTIHDYLL